MKRVMCIHLPLWPLQRVWHDRPELRGRPIALCDGTSAPRIIYYSGPERQGSCRIKETGSVRPGMPVAEALALDSHLHIEELSTELDRAALAQLAEWAGQFSPAVALDGSDRRYALLLDITGCAACFHGEDRLLDRVVRELRERSWNGRVAIADTVGAAWALAHYGATPIWVPPGQVEGSLSPLPVASLRLPDSTVSCLAELGVERVSDLMSLPRSGLPARVGAMVLDRLDQALGVLPEVLVPHRPPPPVEATFSFEYATDHRDAIDYALNQLLGRVCRLLEERQAGARRIDCLLHYEVARPSQFEIELARPSRSVAHLSLLLRTRFEQVTLVEPAYAISLRVPLLVPFDAVQSEMFDSDRMQDDREFARFVDELSNRLGRDVVTRARLVADAQPECACSYEPMIACAGVGSAGAGGRREQAASESGLLESARPIPVRPLRLWAEPICIPATWVMPDGPPVRFQWSAAEHAIVRSWGPERIDTGWWRGRDVQRDYYLVETASGARFWLFRDRSDSRWFLHGCFD